MNTAIISPIKILKENVLFFFILFVSIFLIYGNVLNGQFLSADDLPGIVNNPLVQDFNTSMNSLELEKMFPALLFKIFGMQPLTYHLTSLLMHFINTILVFVFVFLLFGKSEAIIATLIFMVHPLNSETISWISAYGYTFYAAFTLVILIFYLLWTKSQDKKYLIYALITYAICLIFYRKPWSALIPVYIALIDQMVIEKKVNYAKIKVYVLWAIPTLIYLFTYIRDLYAFRTESLITLYYNDPAKATPYVNRVLYTIYMTAKMMLWPIDLTIYHEGEKVPSVELFTVISGLVSLFIIGLVVYLLIKSKTAPWKRNIAAMIILIYSTMLLSFYPEVVVWAMADRYLYIATIFFGVIVGILYTRSKNKKAFGYFIMLLLAFYSVRTLIRTNDWKNSKNLWIATQKVSPYSYRVYNNLGDVYANEGNYPDAIKNFQTSIMLSPTFADAVHNLGFTYYQIGDKETAKMYLQKSYEMNPLLFQSYHKLGVIAYEEGDIELAKQYMMKSLEVKPDFAPAANNLMILQSLPPSTASVK